MDLLGTTLNQRFRLDLEIGRGGFGVVYRATDLHLGREVAVKVLFSQLASDDSVQRFLREAQVSSQLQDQHIITTFDFGIYEGGVIYIVTELLKGLPLDALFSQIKLSLAQTCNLMAQVSQGLASAHALSVIHRDIKPANLFVEWRNQPLVKVIDFGIAKALQTTQEGEGDQLQTKTKALFGTPHYMSPEQVRSTKNVNFASDVYSLGVVFYELVMGELPFNDTEAIQIMIKHLQEPLPSLPSQAPDRHEGVEEALWQRATHLMQNMLRKTEDERLSDWSKIIREFSDLHNALKYSQPESYQAEFGQIKELISGKATSYTNQSNSLSLPKLDTKSGMVSSQSTASGAPRVSQVVPQKEPELALGDTLDSAESLQSPIIDQIQQGSDQTMDWDQSSSNVPQLGQANHNSAATSSDYTLGTVVKAPSSTQVQHGVQPSGSLSKETITPIPDSLNQNDQSVEIVASQMQADFAPKQGFRSGLSQPEARPYPTMFPESFSDEDDDDDSGYVSPPQNKKSSNPLIFVLVGCILMGGAWFLLGQTQNPSQSQDIQVPDYKTSQVNIDKSLPSAKGSLVLAESTQSEQKDPKNEVGNNATVKSLGQEQAPLKLEIAKKAPLDQPEVNKQDHELKPNPSRVRVYFKAQSSYSVGETLRIRAKVWDQNKKVMKLPVHYQVRPAKIARVKGNKLYIKAKGRAKIRACVKAKAKLCSPYKKIYAIDPF